MLHGAFKKNVADYVGFIKKCMKQMQKNEYKLAKKIDLEIRQLSDQEAPLTPGNQKRHCLNIILHIPIDYIVNDACMRLGIEVHVFDGCRQTCCDDKSVTK